jgi:hypothetical protein
MALTLQDLKICYSLALEAREIMDMAESIQAMAERCTPSCSQTPNVFVVTDKVGDGAAELSEFWKRKEGVALKYLEHVTQVEVEIEKLQDSYQRRVLRMRYLQGYSWSLIQTLVQYSERSVFDIHKRGMENLGIIESLQ